jgi:hypothetical protein
VADRVSALALHVDGGGYEFHYLITCQRLKKMLVEKVRPNDLRRVLQLLIDFNITSR